MALTDWRSLTSEGEIGDLPASGFRYKYGMDFVIYLSSSPGAQAALAWSAVGAGTPTPGMHTIRVPMKWKLHIDAPNGDRLFEQTVEMDLWFVALLMSMFGGVAFSLFTWWINEATITTTICNGEELEEGEAPPTLGAEVGFAVPAGGGDYTSNYATILTEWTSPIYHCTLPAGSTFGIDFHNVGYSGLRSSLSSIQTQVIEATGAFVRLPGYGLMMGARAAGEGMEAHAWQAPLGAPTVLDWERSLWSSPLGTSAGRGEWLPSVGGGRVALLWEGAGALLYAESRNVADANGWEGPVTMLPGHTLLGADRDTDGVIYLLARTSGGQVVGYKISRAINRDNLVRTGEPVACVMDTGEALSLTSVDYFEVDRGVCHVVVDRGGSIDYYQGLQGMSTWVRHVDDDEDEEE